MWYSRVTLNRSLQASDEKQYIHTGHGGCTFGYTEHKRTVLHAWDVVRCKWYETSSIEVRRRCKQNTEWFLQGVNRAPNNATLTMYIHAAHVNTHVCVCFEDLSLMVIMDTKVPTTSRFTARWNGVVLSKTVRHSTFYDSLVDAAEKWMSLQNFDCLFIPMCSQYAVSVIFWKRSVYGSNRHWTQEECFVFWALSYGMGLGEKQERP